MECDVRGGDGVAPQILRVRLVPQLVGELQITVAVVLGDHFERVRDRRLLLRGRGKRNLDKRLGNEPPCVVTQPRILPIGRDPKRPQIRQVQQDPTHFYP